jgi:hypothetical protein
VSTTAFSTRGWPGAIKWCCHSLWTVLLLCAACGVGTAHALSQAELIDLRVERSESQLTLAAQTRLELGPAVEEALLKGVPVHFVVQAELTRERWYWYDQTVVQAARYYRLAYQPLTRKWRLNVSTEPLSLSGLAGSLSQNFETLEEALAPLRRISGWRFAEGRNTDKNSQYTLTFRLRLDPQQLPRPFQFGTAAQSDWNLALSGKIRFEPGQIP